MFEEHQAKWPEAIFNEDAWFKYLAPLEEDGNASYLSMLQGSKASQRKWWLNNRFKYMDSKYNAGEALTDVITIRAYAKGDITVTPYAYVYATIKYGSYIVQSRAERGTPITLICPLDSMNDTECYIYSASQLASVGDLSGLMVGYADFSMAVKLQSLTLGRSNTGIPEEQWYRNGNLQTLYLGNNTLLQSIDVRNCTGLGTGEQTTVDISGCSNVRTLLFEGTNITGINLPDGGVIEKLHLPGTITILKVLNQQGITDFTCPDLTHLTTLWLDNTNIDAVSILPNITSGSRVRLFNFSYSMNEAHDVTDFMDVLDTMRGLDQAGNNTPTAQVYGTIHIPAASTWFLNEVERRYNDLRITYDVLYQTVLYRNYDDTLIEYELVEAGEDAIGDVTATRDPSPTTVYTFDGWAASIDGPVDPDALTNITVQRAVYAHYAESIRYYRVRFFSAGVLLDTQYVAYGGYAVYYDSTTGSSTPPYRGTGDPTDFVFSEWNQDISYITSDVDASAVFVYSPVYTRHYLQDTLTSFSSNLTDLGPFAFAGNTALATLSLPNLAFSNGTVPRYCFAWVSNLTSLTLGTGTFLYVTEVEDYAFMGFLSGHRIRDIHDQPVPQTLNFPHVETIGDSAFQSTGELNLYFPMAMTIGKRAFYFGCVVTLSLPAVSNLGNSNDETYMYLNHSESILWSGLRINTTPTADIGTFSNSTLRVLDCGMTTRLTQTLNRFTALEEVTFRNTSVVSFSSSDVYSSGIFATSSPIGKGLGHIYVPSELITAYQTSPGWSIYADCFEAIT